MIVMKFGGTSVGSVDALRQVAVIVRRELDAQQTRPGVVVVTSAMSGVTDLLSAAAQAAANADHDRTEATCSRLRTQHAEVTETLVDDADVRWRLTAELEETIRQLRRVLDSIAVLGELTPRGNDWICGTGEQVMAPLLTEVLKSAGVAAVHANARSLIVTDDNFGAAEPLVSETESRCQTQLTPLLAQGRAVVTGGFIGSTFDGLHTTLGRGGSDYSAAILGAALDADEIQIWTDVSGVKTADPKVVPDARSLREITFPEIAELAYYGARVIHPKTVRPAIRKGIGLRVLNTFEPDHAGTRVIADEQRARQAGIKAISAIRDMNMIMIEGRGMIGVPGIAARAFRAVSDVNANVLMISQSSSEQSICFVVPDDSADMVINALRREFSMELDRGYIERIDGDPDIVIVAAVGQAIRHTPGIAARVFSALGDARINVVSIAQGASDTMISLVVVRDAADAAVNTLHRAFNLAQPTG